MKMSSTNENDDDDVIFVEVFSPVRVPAPRPYIIPGSIRSLAPVNNRQLNSGGSTSGAVAENGDSQRSSENQAATTLASASGGPREQSQSLANGHVSTVSKLKRFVNVGRDISCLLCGVECRESQLLKHVCEKHFTNYRPYKCGECDYCVADVGIFWIVHMHESGHVRGCRNYVTYGAKNEKIEHIINLIHAHCLEARGKREVEKNSIINRITQVTEMLRDQRQRQLQTEQSTSRGSGENRRASTISLPSPCSVDASPQLLRGNAEPESMQCETSATSTPQNTETGQSSVLASSTTQNVEPTARNTPTTPTAPTTSTTTTVRHDEPTQSAIFVDPLLQNVEPVADAETQSNKAHSSTAPPSNAPRPLPPGKARKTIAQPTTTPKRMKLSGTEPVASNGNFPDPAAPTQAESMDTTQPSDSSNDNTASNKNGPSSGSVSSSGSIDEESSNGPNNSPNSSPVRVSAGGKSGSTPSDQLKEKYPPSAGLVCDFCDFVARNTVLLYRHQMKQHLAGYVPFKCTIKADCGFAPTWKQFELRNHMASCHKLFGSAQPSPLTDEQRSQVMKVINSLDGKKIRCEELKNLL